jgi:hypothetical protein
MPVAVVMLRGSMAKDARVGLEPLLIPRHVWGSTAEDASDSLELLFHTSTCRDRTTDATAAVKHE